MNYLAHIYLSGNNKNVQLGNFMGDFVKGNGLNVYDHDIQKGILLHRKIDSYTDQHPIVTDLNKFLNPTFSKFSPIILDMYFDYFLAKNFSTFSHNLGLRLFTYKFNVHLLRNYPILPEKIKRFVFHFVFTNRLYQYQHIQGLSNSLLIMSKYKNASINPTNSINFLQLHEDYLFENFKIFFNDIQHYVMEME